MSRASEIVRATGEAARLVARYGLGNRTSFDITGVVLELGIPLLYRPLDGLWGATITVAGMSGMLVTSKLPRHVQRFTLAHELGHVILGHQTSLDDTVGFLGRHGATSRPDAEIAADTFASELLAPRNLMLASARRHGWTKREMVNPATIYQLALRLGISFKAACWALVTHRVLTRVGPGCPGPLSDPYLEISTIRLLRRKSLTEKNPKSALESAAWEAGTALCIWRSVPMSAVHLSDFGA